MIKITQKELKMYWKATLENINDELKDKNIITEYYGYIDREVYPEWDTEVAKEIYLYLEEQISNEDADAIYKRNKVMLDNSVQTATFVAYEHAGIKINIKQKKNKCIFRSIA